MLIINCDGIGSANVSADDSRSILKKVSDPLATDLRAHGFEVQPARLEWPASMAGVGGRLSWTQSVAVGLLGLDAIVDRQPDEKIVLLGYSGGCRVVHEWLETRPEQHHRVVAVGLMSDPFRPRDAQQAGMPKTRGWGVCGQKSGLEGHTFWVAVPGDVITDALEDAILRTPADASDVMPGAFVNDLRTHVRKGDLQLAWQIGVFRTNPLGWFAALGRRLDQARRDIEGYLGGTHTTAYVTPWEGGATPAQRFASTLSWAVRQRA